MKQKHFASWVILCFPHGNTKDNILVMELFIKNLRSHVTHKQTHVHMSLSLHFSCQQVDIMFIPNGVCILINVTIIDLKWMGLVSQVAIFRTMVTKMATEAKDKLYCN